jgi:hypothetical protein
MKSSTMLSRPTIAITIACLFLMPLYQIGDHSDFQMRATIMPLALLSLAIAELVGCLAHQEGDQRKLAMAAILLLGIGSATGLLELKRAVTLLPSPEPRCSLIGVWFHQTVRPAPYSTYLAPASSFPAFVRHDPDLALDTAGSRKTCWDRPWKVKREMPIRIGDTS